MAARFALAAGIGALVHTFVVSKKRDEEKAQMMRNEMIAFGFGRMKELLDQIRKCTPERLNNTDFIPSTQLIQSFSSRAATRVFTPRLFNEVCAELQRLRDNGDHVAFLSSGVCDSTTIQLEIPPSFEETLCGLCSTPITRRDIGNKEGKFAPQAWRLQSGSIDSITHMSRWICGACVEKHPTIPALAPIRYYHPV